MLAFSLPVIIWKMWLTNDCSFTVLFISKARAFLVLLQRNPLAAAVSFVRCWRSALFPELPHPWSETLEGNLWFKQLISGLFFFSFFFSSLSQLPPSEGEGAEPLAVEWNAIWYPQTEPLPSSWPCDRLQKQSSLWICLSPPMLLLDENKTNKKKSKSLPTKQTYIFYLPWLQFHQYNGSVCKLWVFVQGGTNTLQLFLWYHNVIITWSLCLAEVCMF